MKTRIAYAYRNSVIELLLDDGSKGAERKVLAAMTHFEGTSAWMIVDTRLHRYRSPSQYSGGLLADDIHAFLKPDSEQDAAVIRSMLREFTEDEKGIHWSSYEGLVRGTPREGDEWLRRFSHVGFFTKKEGLEYLKHAQIWWDSYDGDPDEAKIENPHRQATLSQVIGELVARKLGIAQGRPPQARARALKP